MPYIDYIYDKILLIPTPYFPMPLLSDRQKHANTLLEAYVLSVILEAQEGTSMHDTDSTGSGWNTDSDAASDASSGWGPEDDTCNVSDLVIEACHKLYQTFYIEECCKIPKTCENLDLLLTEYKSSFPDIFHSYLRLSPQCFNSLLETIQHHEAFQNKSNSPQCLSNANLQLHCTGLAIMEMVSAP